MVTPFSSAIWRKRSEIGNSTITFTKSDFKIIVRSTRHNA